MKKGYIPNFFVPIVAIFVAIIFALSACDKDPGGAADGFISDAIDAFNLGKKHFEEVATHYESTYEGMAKPLGLGSIAGEQKVYTRRYLSSNGDFIYDTANYSGGAIDVSFSMLLVKQGAASGVHYKKIDGRGHLSVEGGVLRADYNDLSLSQMTAASDSEFSGTCGFVPRELFNYVINTNTILAVDYFKTGDEAGEFAKLFKLRLRSSAHENYKKQVEFFSGRDYGSFSNLTLEIAVDHSGRIVRVATSEEYSVKAGINQKMRVEGTQTINYDKNPTINFDGFVIN